MCNPVDRVDLTLPRHSSAASAMRMAVGWVASCHNVGLDTLDDIDLALETLIADEPETGPRLSLRVSVDSDTFRLVVGGLQNRSLQANLTSGAAFQPSPGWPLDVRIFLSALVDGYSVVECGGSAFSVEFWKRID